VQNSTTCSQAHHLCSHIAWQMTLMHVLILMSDGNYRCHRTRNIESYLKWNEGGTVGVWHTCITVLSTNSRCGMKMFDEQHSAKNEMHNPTHFTYIYYFSNTFHILVFLILIYPAEYAWFLQRDKSVCFPMIVIFWCSRWLSSVVVGTYLLAGTHSFIGEEPVAVLPFWQKLS
jgi:hypothetical protein